MAGNIIPAIASTNAIIAGQIVFQAISMLAGEWQQASFVSLTRASTGRVLNGFPMPKPNPACGVCAENYGLLRLPSLEITLADVVNKIIKTSKDEGGLGFEDDDAEIAIYDGSRLLADPDFDDNLESSLGQLGLKDGSILSVADEGDSPMATINLYLEVASADSTEKDLCLRLRDEGAELKKKYIAPPEEEESDLDDDDDDVVLALDKAPAPIVGQKRKANAVDGDAVQDASSVAEGAAAKKQKVADVADPNLVVID